MATSSGSSIVNLGEAADLNEVTSKIFFSDTSVLSWPAAMTEIDSILKNQDSLVALCSKHGVPGELTPVCASRLGWTACTPPPVGSNNMCVYAAALEAGLRFPLHGFYARLLRHYGLAPSQLTPNSWSYLAAFVLLCQDVEVEPSVYTFRYFFNICAHRHQGKPTGWHHFQTHNNDSRRLFAGILPSRSGWKSRFFFLHCPSGWNCPVKWGKPKREHARQVQLTCRVETLMLKVKKIRDKQIGGIDIKGIDIKVFLANHEMPVGDPAALDLLQSAVKLEARAAGAGAAGAAGAEAAGANAEDATTRKRSRLSPAAVLCQSQPLPTTAPPEGFAPIRASSTGGRSEHNPPPSLPPIRASGTGGRASSTGGHSGHTPPPQQRSLRDYTSAPLELPGTRAQVVSMGGNIEVTPLALQLWEAKAEASKQAAMIAKLSQELDLMKTWNSQWQKLLRAARAEHAAEKDDLRAHLGAANDRNNHLNEQLVRLNNNYMAEREQLIGHLRSAIVEVEQLKTQHAEEKDQLKKELADEAKQLKEELAEDAEQLKQEGYTLGASDMRDLTLAMFKDVIRPDDLKVEMLLNHNHHIQ